MKIKLFTLLYTFLFLSCTALPTHIKIQQAKKENILALCQLNRSVEFEYFKPLYKKGYKNLPLGKNPDPYLEKELQKNKEWFLQSIQKKNDNTLYVAHDTKKHKLAGMISVSKESKKTLEIDLLLVEKKYRKLGIGRALIAHAIKQFPHITTCIVFPLKHANKKTLQFYASVGFKPCDLPKEYQDYIVKPYNVLYSDVYLFYKKEIKAS